MKTKKVVRFLFFKLPVVFITISVLWVLVLLFMAAGVGDSAYAEPQH